MGFVVLTGHGLSVWKHQRFKVSSQRRSQVPPLAALLTLMVSVWHKVAVVNRVGYD